MKRFLLSLLVLVMFTPSLACAQFMQAQKPHMEMAGMAKSMPCCPKETQKSDMGGMLFKDCAKIDLQHATDAPLLKKADIAKISPYILPPAVAAHSYGTMQARLIRGPPPPEITGSYPPVFLATQRLRI